MFTDVVPVRRTHHFLNLVNQVEEHHMSANLSNGTRSTIYRRLAWLVMLLLLASNLSVLPTSVAAQGDCEEGFVLDEESGECVEGEESPDVVTDEAPSNEGDEPTPTPSPTDEPEATGSIEIRSFECPVLEDASTEIAWLAENCTTPSAGVAYFVDSEGDADPVSAATNADGYVRFDELDAETYSITRDPGEISSVSNVFCQNTADGSSPQAVKVFGDAQNQVRLTLDPGTTVGCSWFVTPATDAVPTETPGDVTVETAVPGEDPEPTTGTETGETSTISVSVNFCPLDLDLNAATADDLAENCTLGGPIVEFDVTAEGKLVDHQVAAGTPATATFNGVPLDNLVVSQILPEGVTAPVVYCEILGEDGAVLSGYQPESLTAESSIGGSLSPGATLSCDFFNGVETTVDPEASPGSVERLAPDDNDDGPGGPLDLESASVTITAYECLAPSFELPDEVAQFDEPPASMVDPGDVIPDKLPDQVLQDPTSTEFAGCTPTHEGVSFQIARRGNQIYKQTVVSSGSPAIAAFPNAYADGVYIMSPVLENFSINPIVVCGSSVQGPLRFEGTTSQYGIVIYDLMVDEVMNCNWYNFQLAAPGTVVIKHRLCNQSDGLPANDLAVLRAQCSDLTNEAELTVSRQGGSPGTPQNVAAWPGGIITWENLTPGTLIASQNFVGPFGYPAVYCRSSTAGMPGPIGLRLQPVLGDARNLVSLNLEADSTVYCEWFIAKNGFVRLQDGPVNLNVDVVSCPPGIDQANSDIYDLAFACHDPAQVVQVSLTQQGGGTASVTTPGTYPNSAKFPAMAELNVVLEVGIPVGFASITPFCDHLDGIPGNSSIDPEPVSGADLNQFPFQLLFATFGLDNCTVYLFPAENDSGEDPAGPDADPAALTGEILVNVHACPQEFDAFKSDMQGLATNCTDPMAGVEFTAIPGQGKELISSTEGDFASLVSFPEIPAGVVSLSVTAGGDGFAYRVTCVADSAAVSRSPGSGETTVTGTGIAIEVQPGQSFVCDWYAIPPDPILDKLNGVARGPERDLSLQPVYTGIRGEET
jgi:hypothetical protein